MASSPRFPSQLWPHQKAALRNVHKYLSDPDRGSKAALTSMPTGTGKTGVIAVAAALLPHQTKNKLILTPWVPLVHQLIRDLGGRFWSRAGIPIPRNLPRVMRLPPSSNIERISDDAGPTVYLATIAAIETLARRAGSDLPGLFSNFDFVIVDEGHYEPAPKWSQAIRALDLPTVLLTATPYRNDHNLFPPTDGFRYRFAHHEAVDKRYLRSPTFELIDETDVDKYVAALLQLVSSRFDDAPRVIIRCDDEDQIRQMVKALERAGESVLGVHERFGNDPILLRKVPNPEERDERFWVHQYKLIEGVDDPRFKVLAFFAPLKNDRAIVQQIGRVLRNPAQDPQDMTALVIDNQIPAAHSCWEAYTRFDRQEQATSITTHGDLVDHLLASQPDVFYFDGAYRVRVNLNSATAWKEFAYPLATRVFKADGQDNVGVMELAELVAAEWRKRDREVFRIQQPDERTAIVPYVTAENSPWMKRGTFVVAEFGYTLLRKTKVSLYVTDTRDSMPSLVSAFSTYSPNELQQLFPAEVTTLKTVSLLNTDIGRHSARSRTIYAPSISDLAPDLGDYAYVCSTANGRTTVFGVPTGRYVGMTRGRVSDRRATDRTYTDFDTWLTTLDQQIAKPSKATEIFTRYAQQAATPAKPDPRHVLLDIDPADFSVDGLQEEWLVVDDLASDVDDGVFDLVIGEGSQGTHQCQIDWDALRQKYQVSSDSLRAMNYRQLGSDGRELLRYVNEEQALRVVPVTPKLIYSNGSFFKPVLPNKDSLLLTDLLYTDEAFSKATDEKGDDLVGGDWDPTSLFGLISALAPTSGREPPASFAEFLSNPDFLFCSDLGAEVADFVIKKGDRVAFVHAKASSKTRKYSASALQTVVGQAAKNLQFIHPLAAEDPDKRRWNSPWKHPKSGAQTNRLRVGDQSTPREIWQSVKDQMIQPDCVREVWLVLGNTLSKCEFVERIESRSPEPEALQLYTLLASTWGSVSQMGARLRVFCSP